MGVMKQPIDVIGKILGIKVLGQLLVFVVVLLVCIYLAKLEPLWSAIIAMFSAFGTILATWKLGR